MKALKIIGIIVGLLIAIFLIVPIFLANQVTISSHTTIQAKPVTIFHEVSTLTNWSHWSPFHAADTAMVSEFTGPERGVGATMTWLSKTLGDGQLVIAECKPYTYIQNNISFQPDNGTARGEWNFEETPDGVSVTWTTTMPDLKYPMGRYMGLLSGMMMDPFMASGLSKLKSYCESLPAPPDIEMVDVESVPSLSILDSTTVDGIGEMLGRNYELISAYMTAKKLDMAGIPYAVYYNWDPNGIIHIRAAIPVAKADNGKGQIEFFELPATKAVMAKHMGGYDTSTTHEAIMEYMQDFGIECADYIWEVYVTDPMTEPDESKWETDVYYPVK